MLIKNLLLEMIYFSEDINYRVVFLRGRSRELFRYVFRLNKSEDSIFYSYYFYVSGSDDSSSSREFLSFNKDFYGVFIYSIRISLFGIFVEFVDELSDGEKRRMIY